MTKDVITSKLGTSMDEAKDVLKSNRIEKLPLIDDERKIHGLFTTQDILNMENYPIASQDNKGRPLVGAAVGVKGDFLERTESLLEAGTDAIVVDIAHGHSENAINTIKTVSYTHLTLPTSDLV